MADLFVDDTATGANSGANPTDAWTSYNSVTGQVAGDRITIRRGHSEVLAVDFAPAPDGTRENPIDWMCAPRIEDGNFEGDWLNGSLVLIDVKAEGGGVKLNGTPLTDRGLWMGRMIKNDADGKWYMITAILVKTLWDAEITPIVVGDMLEDTSGCQGLVHYVSGNNFWAVTFNQTTGLPDVFTDTNDLSIVGGAKVAEVADANSASDGFHLDREFAGTTESNGASTVQADSTWADRSAEIQDDVGTNVNWDADAGGLPIIDFSTNVNNMYINFCFYNRFYGFDVRNGQDTSGTVVIGSNQGTKIKYFLINRIHNAEILGFAFGLHGVKVQQTIVVGTYTGAAQNGYENYTAEVSLDNVAIYNCGNLGIYSRSLQNKFNNVSVGVELPCGDNSIFVVGLTGKDILVDDTNGGIEVIFNDNASPRIFIENYQKILGEHLSMFISFDISRNDGSGADVNLRAGGSSSVIDVVATFNRPAKDTFATEIFEWYFPKMSAASHTVKVFVQNTAEINAVAGVDSDDFWLEVDYVDKYDDTSEYTMGKNADGLYLLRSTSSNNPIPPRANADDWAEFLTITFTVAVESLVRVRLMSGWYDASENVYIDMNPDVS